MHYGIVVRDSKGVMRQGMTTRTMDRWSYMKIYGELVKPKKTVSVLVH